MTRKDYKLIAEAILAARTWALAADSGITSNDTLNYLTGYLTGGLQNDNPRFDRVKFAEASGAKQFGQRYQQGKAVTR